MSLVDIAVPAGHKFLMEVDNNILLIVGNPQGILKQQLKPPQSQSTYKILILFLIY